MSISINDKTNNQEILLAGKPKTDLILNPISQNPIANKAVYDALAEKIDNTVDNLINYYLKSDVFNKTEVRALISTVSTLTIEVVGALPVTDIDPTVIYFVGPDSQGGYDQYVYINNDWVSLGNTNIDLSQYITTTNLNLILQDYYTKTDIDAKVQAKAIAFDNTGTDIVSTNVEDAIKEVFLNAGAQVQEVTMAYYLAHQAELDASGDLIVITDSGIANSAANVTYDNTNSGFVAENVQGAIDEVNDNIYSSLLVEAVNVQATYNNSFRATGTTILSKQGYKPLGTLSAYVSNNTTYNGVAGVDFDIATNQVSVAIFTLNHSSGSGNETVKVNVLWQKV